MTDESNWYYGSALAAIPLFLLYSLLNDCVSTVPRVTLVPPLAVLHTAFMALAQPQLFVSFLVASKPDNAGATMLCLGTVWLLASMGGAAFFAYDTTWFPSCNWAITPRTCCHRPRPWSVWLAIILGIATGVAVLINNILSGLIRYGVITQSPSTLWVFRVAPAGPDDSAVAEVVWALVWAVVVPATVLLLLYLGGPRVHFHLHHYIAAFYLGVLVRGPSIFSFICHGIAWGIMLQGAWVAAMGRMLESPRT